jgi:hypothetical protein
MHTTSNKLDSPIAWTAFAGVSFALIRLLIGAGFIYGTLLRDEAGIRGAVDAAWLATASASIGAGLVASAMFWRFRRQTPALSNGVLVGAFAATGSYASVVLGFIAWAAVQWIAGSLEVELLMVVVGSVGCGLGSFIVTGSVVFPVLMVWGVFLYATLRASVDKSKPHETKNGY